MLKKTMSGETVLTATAGLTACPSCGATFTATGGGQPLVISCGDTFCRRCVQDLTDTCGILVCPCCGEINEEEESDYNVNGFAISLRNKSPHIRNNSDTRLSQGSTAMSSTLSNSSDTTITVSSPMASNQDICESCCKDFGQAADELEHCPHCGKAVCPVCKGEHKMVVLERLHGSRAKIQEKLEDMRFSQQYKKETLAQLKLQGDAECERIKSALEKAKMLMIEELDKRKEALLKEVSNYVTNTVLTLESQLAQCSTAVSDVNGRLERVTIGDVPTTTNDNNNNLENQTNNEDFLQLCQHQLTYGKCLKILDNCLKEQLEMKATMLKFSDSCDSMNLLNAASKYGSLTGSPALETNLKASEGLLSKISSSGDFTMQTKRLHRYRTIVGGTPLLSVSFGSGNSNNNAASSGHKNQLKNAAEYLCVLKDDRVAVACANESSILIFDRNLENKESVRIEQFASLRGICSTNTKLVLLRNSLELYSLDNYKSSGKFFGSSELVNPTTVVASHNRMFVYDQDKDRNLHYVVTFEASGRYISKRFITEARCDLSISLSVIKGKTADDTLLISGSCKSVYLKVLNTSCETLWEFNMDEPKIQGRKWRPQDTTTDNEGNFLVLDSSGRKILIFNKDGKFCSQFDPFSIRDGHANKVGVNSDGQVILLDMNSSRILMF